MENLQEALGNSYENIMEIMFLLATIVVSIHTNNIASK